MRCVLDSVDIVLHLIPKFSLRLFINILVIVNPSPECTLVGIYIFFFLFFILCILSIVCILYIVLTLGENLL